MSPLRARTARASGGGVAAPDRDRLLELSAALRDVPVAVVGDLVLDRYWFGRSSRISREAPVLILEFEEERGVPGGAANAAMNLRALGGRPRLLGRVGRDPAGALLARALRAEGLDARYLLRDGAGATIVKTRILAGSSHTSRQQLVRLDRGDRAAIAHSGERALLGALKTAMRGSRAVLLSDYGYGVLGPALKKASLREARLRGVP